MNRGKVARGCVVALAAAGILLFVRPAGAQFLAPALDRPGFDRRPTQPSLRLATLGGLSLAMPDENNEINLWDFGGSTLGLLGDRDSTSLDVYLDSGRQSDKHTLGTTDYQLDRDSRFHVGMEAVGRHPGSFAAGVDVGLLSNTTGTPAQPGIYRNYAATQPLAVPAMNGRMLGGNWGWGARFTFAGQSVNNDLKNFSQKGDEFDMSGGSAVDPPSPFDPTDGKLNVSGLGLGIGYYGIRGIQLAFNVDRLVSNQHQSFDTARRIYETDEHQPAGEYSVTGIAHKGWAQLGAQVGELKFHSTEQYRFSLSGGLVPSPLESRGDRLHRDFKQDWLRTRLQLDPPAVRGLTIASDFAVRYDREIVDPSIDPGNFNGFMQDLSGDTLVTTTSIAHTRSELRHWNAGAGLGYRVNSRVAFGVEGHRYNNAADNGVDVHARQRISDLRGGLEFVVTPSWMARLGGYHVGNDADVYTANNEDVTNAFTAGFGWAPRKSRSHRTVDAGIEYGRRSSNYPDPTEITGRVFRFVLYNRWAF
jgi:hypothetical protein